MMSHTLKLQSEVYKGTDYNERTGESFAEYLRIARHLELILFLMSLQTFSFSSLVLAGNLVKTITFSELSLALSRHFLS